MDACYEVTAGERARGGFCDLVTSRRRRRRHPFDSPASPFNGVSRALTVNANRVSNAAGPEVWYTDALGASLGAGPDYSGDGVRPLN